MNEKNVVHTHNGILLSYKKEWNAAICNNMDGSGDYPTIGSKSDKYHMILLSYGI